MENRNSNGILIERYQIDSDSLNHGQYITYYPDGKLMEKSYYLHGWLNGTRELYYPSQALEISESYKLGKLDGDYVRYYENGVISFKAKYIDNKMQGNALRYYKSGNLMEIVQFKDNQENGSFVEYYENGNKKWEGTYLNGDNEVGELYQFDVKGQMIKKLFCDSLSICQTIWTLEAGDIPLKKISLRDQ